jgi:hypothetical protein
MQNLPDKGVSGSLYYLWDDYTVTGLTRMVHESQGRNEGDSWAFPTLGSLQRQTGVWRTPVRAVT